MKKAGTVKKIYRFIIQGIGLATISILLLLIISSSIYIIAFRLEVKRFSKHIKTIFEQSDLIGQDIQVALDYLPWPNEIDTRRELKFEGETEKISKRGDYYGALIYYTDKDFFKRVGFFIGRGFEVLYDQNDKIIGIN